MPIIDEPGQIKLLVDLPYPEEHGCFKGETFEAIRSFKDDQEMGSIGEEKVFFVSNAPESSDNRLVSAVNDSTLREFEYTTNPPQGEKD